MKKFDNVMEKRLLEILKEELEIFKQIKAKVLEQTKQLAADEMDEFFKSLDSSDKLKEKINGLHQEKEPLMQSYLKSSEAVGNVNKKTIAMIEDAIRKLVIECADLTKQIFEAANTKKDEYLERLKELETEKKTLNAYTVTMPDNSEHFDKST